MLILLPPSEGKNPAAGAGRFLSQAPDYARDAEGVVTWLQDRAPEELSKLYKVKDTAKAAAIHDMNLAALDGPTLPTLPALDRYTGVVYEHMGLDDPHIRRAAGKRVLIVSGYFGLIPASLAIPDYKLPLNPWLLRYWKGINTQRLQERAKNKPVLDLLPQSHQKALEYPHLLRVDFRVAGGARAAGHFGKAIKGKFVRWLLENNINQPSRFAEFTEDGYRWDGANFIQ